MGPTSAPAPQPRGRAKARTATREAPGRCTFSVSRQTSHRAILAMRLPIVVPLCLLLMAGSLPGQAPDPAATATARRLLVLLGTEAQMVAVMKAGIPAQRAATPQLPGVFWDSLEARLVRETPQLLNDIVPEYARSFTEVELLELVRFYESPIGRRLIAEQTGLMQRSMEIGQRWGMRLGTEVAQDLVKAGLIKP